MRVSARQGFRRIERVNGNCCVRPALDDGHDVMCWVLRRSALVRCVPWYALRTCFVAPGALRGAALNLIHLHGACENEHN